MRSNHLDFTQSWMCKTNALSINSTEQTTWKWKKIDWSQNQNTWYWNGHKYKCLQECIRRHWA